jgi:hypothetical protein
MVRSILAVLAAPLVWGLVQALGGQAAMMAYPEAASATVFPVGFLVLSLVLSVVYSLVSGAVTGAIARNKPLVHGVWAGVVLLAVGIAVQVQYWNLMPLWYHIAFLALLVPMAVAGALWMGGRSAARAAAHQ